MRTETNRSARTGPLHGFVNLIGSAYLIGMLAYLLLRLVLGSSFWWLALLNAFVVYTFAPLLVLVPVAAILGLWRLVTRLALLALLAVLWFGPFFQPRSVDPPVNPIFRVVTYNIWANNNQSLYTDEMWLGQTGADVIMIQEVPNVYREAEGIDSLRELYPYQVRGRLLTLSRYPVLESEELVNGQQRLVLDVDGQQIAIYNIHLAWPLGNPARINLPLLNLFSKYDETRRNEQIAELLDYWEDETLPYVVAGDFNTSQHSLIYSDLAVAMDDSFRETEAGLGHTWPTDSRVGALLRLDYVWYNNGLRAVNARIGPALGSDHFPLIADLELPQ